MLPSCLGPSVDFQFRRYENGANDIAMTVYAVYTPEEFQALANTGAAMQPCIDKIYPTISFWVGTVTIYRPTFLQLSDPGLLFEGFTEYWANEFQKDFEYWYGATIRANLAPILQWFRRESHRELEQQRDAYFGARPALPLYRQPLLPRK